MGEQKTPAERGEMSNKTAFQGYSDKEAGRQYASFKKGRGEGRGEKQ